MGSFNLSCFASQRTIAERNKVFLIPISQQSTYQPVHIQLNELRHSVYGNSHDFCHTDCFWKYAGPIIEATYEDYGRFKLTNNVSNQSNLIAFFNTLYEKLFKAESGNNKTHELAIDFQEIYHPKNNYSFADLEAIWHELWTVGTKNRLFIEEKGVPRQLQFAALHRKSYQFFEKQSDYLYTKFNDVVEEKLKLTLKSFKRNDQSIKTSQSNEVFKASVDFFSYYVARFASIDQHSVIYDDLYNNKHRIQQYIIDYMHKHPKEELEKSITNISKKIQTICSTSMKHLVIHSNLNSLNIKLSPVYYAGQDYNNSIGKSFLEFIQSVNG